jgi:hypothetical protein
MNITKIISIPVFTLLSSLSLADVSDDLIAMDKQWGMAGGPAGYVSEDVIGIGPTGVVNFGNLVADAAANANVGEEYVVSGYSISPRELIVQGCPEPIIYGATGFRACKAITLLF